MVQWDADPHLNSFHHKDRKCHHCWRLQHCTDLWKDWPSPLDTWQSIRLEREHLQCCCYLLPAGWPQSALSGSSLYSTPALFKFSQQGQRRWKEITALPMLLHNSIFSSPLSSLRACKILFPKVFPTLFLKSGSAMMNRHRTEVRCKAGMLSSTPTLQQLEFDLYFELSLYGLQGEKCE